MDEPRKPPEAPPEAPGSRWLTMPDVGRLLDLSERAARDWVKRQHIPTRGSRPVRVSEQAVLAAMVAEERIARKPPEVTPEVPGSAPEGPGSGSSKRFDEHEPIEAAYRVAGGDAAPAALVPLDRMLAQVQGLAEELAELARRNEGLALEVGQLREREAGHAARRTAQDQARAAHQETIAELRRRAEAAEGERDVLRLQLAEVAVPPVVVAAAQDAPAGPHATGTPSAAHRPIQGLWWRLRRAWRRVR